MRFSVFKKPKKILIIFFDLDIGGVQRKIADIINFLKTDTSIEVTLLLERRTKNSFLNEILLPAQIKVFYKEDYFIKLPVLGKKSVAFSFFLLLWMFVSNYSYVYVFLPKLCFQLSLCKRLLFWKTFKLIGSQDVVFSDNVKREKWSSWMVQSYGWMCRVCDVYFVQSSYSKKDIVARFPELEAKITILPNWCLFSPPKEVERIYDCCIITRMDAEKNMSDIYNVLYFISKKEPKRKILVVGTGAKTNWLLKKLKKLKLSIDYIPYSMETKQHLAKSKILLSLSKSEGMPMTFLEAMVCRTLIVSLYFPGIEDVIPNKGIGLVCGSTDKMGETVLDVWQNTNKRKKITEQAFLHQKKQFGLVNLKQYFKLLAE